MSTSSTRPQSPSAWTGLSPPKVTVSAACTCGPAGGAGLHVDAAGDVDGDHRDARVVDGGEHLGGAGPQRTGAGDADDAVDHQIGCRRDALHDAAAGLPERRQRLLVSALGIEQDRRGRRAAATQECRRPQRVTAVVAGADDRANRPAGDRRCGPRARGRSRWQARRPPAASARRRAGDASSGASASRIASAE